MGIHQFRRSVSMSVEDFLLLGKLSKKLGGSQASLVGRLIRREAKKYGIVVTDSEVEEYKEDLIDKWAHRSKRRFS